jgi:hypothetical protein
MARYYKSPFCKNCGRNKQQVSRSRGSSELDNYAEWLRLPYCRDCVEHRCKEPLTYLDTSTVPPAIGYSRCSNRAMVVEKGQHPPVYRDYCEKHWPSYAFCPRCRQPKEVWAMCCPACRAKDQAKLDRDIIRRWRAAGMLCPICKKRPKNGAQIFCAHCLQARGARVLPVQSTMHYYFPEYIAARLAERKSQARSDKRRRFLKRQRKLDRDSRREP